MNQAEQIKTFLLKDIKRLLKSTAGKETDLSKTVVWLKEFHPDRGLAVLGILLSDGAGCSNTCLCAVNQISEYIGKMLKDKFEFVKIVRGEAEMSLLVPRSVLEEWNKDESVS